MRSVNATLHAALQSGDPTPFLKAYVGYTDGTVKNAHTDCFRYRLTGTTLEFWIPTVANYASDQEAIWLERGLTIAGTDYTITTGRFFIWEEEHTPEGWTRLLGGLLPREYYSDSLTTDDYETVIDALFAAYGKTTTYKDSTEGWLAYQFMPDPTELVMADANRMLALLRAKRLVGVCDNGGEDVRVYSADVFGTAAAAISLTREFSILTTAQRSRQYIWVDENGTVHTDGAATDPLHNLGWLASTDSPPARNSITREVRAILRPDLRLQDGDTLTVSFDGGSKTATIFARVTEAYDARAKKSPRWRTILEADQVFYNAEALPLPRAVADGGNFAAVNTSQFANVLDEKDSNIQAAFDTLDAHHPNGAVREVLAANRSYYVRHDVGACTFDTGTDEVTASGHGLHDDDPVVFVTDGTLPTGLTAGTIYYVINGATDTFQVAATEGGGAIDLTGSPSGNHRVATGNDSNDGLSTGRLGALLTVNQAVALARALDLSTFVVTIQLARSRYTENVDIDGYVGGDYISIVGDTTTPTNVELSGSWTMQRWSRTWYASGLYMSGGAMVAYPGAFLVIAGKMDFGGSGPHLWAYGGYIQCATAYTISASTLSFTPHILSSNGGYVYLSGSHTVTITGTPNWAWSFVYASNGGRIEGNGTTYSGACTGTRYYADLNGTILTYGSGANYFPGNAAGGTASGGQYA